MRPFKLDNLFYEWILFDVLIRSFCALIVRSFARFMLKPSYSIKCIILHDHTFIPAPRTLGRQIRKIRFTYIDTYCFCFFLFFFAIKLVSSEKFALFENWKINASVFSHAFQKLFPALKCQTLLCQLLSISSPNYLNATPQIDQCF